MARRRTNYNVDTRTKILDTHTQFMGGLKTVDTDDSVKDFFLRDVENISLSEFGFLERRYGLVEDANLQFLVDVENDIPIPNTENVIFKDRLQGYFEYTRPDKIVEQIIFYNGRLYLNGVQVTQLYQYPSKFDPILGRYNNNISIEKFQDYLERVHNREITSFSDIDDLFNTGRQVEGVKIDDRMFFFTGVYPIVYQGTGEFYLLPEFVTNFEQLALFSHNLHTADLDATYTAGFPASEITLDMTGETRGFFSELGYAPMYPYMMGEGAGFEVRLNYKLPPISLYTTNLFNGFFTNGQPNTSARYLELVPEVYYRGSGLSAGVIEEVEVTEVIGNVIVDETWTRVAPSNVEYTVLSNLNPNNTNPDVFDYAGQLAGEGDAIPSFITDVNKSLNAEALYSTNQQSFNITLKNIPSGLYDILVVYKIYSAKWNDQNLGLIEEVVDQTPEIIRNITFTREKTDDYVNVVTDDEGVEIAVPVNNPAALWTCNRVLNHYGKLMAYGSIIHPERIFISHPTFIHYFPYFFTRDFETDTQEELQQITPFMNILVVQTETYTWGLKGIDAVLGAPNFYTPFVISPIYGTIAPKSVRPVRNQLFFLSQDGIVSIQSLYAIDEQYNVKHIDKNIENIVPLDPEAVAIQYDNQYWIQFPNTPNNMTLRYHVDLKAWMKDTYFEYNGLDNNGRPKLSETIFNGVHKYIREDDKLVLITNPMRLGKNLEFVDDDENYRVMRLYVDYSIATDVKEVPRALFETSYLDQDYPFNEKKYLEQKMQFTIQNEYHLGKEPIFRDESIQMRELDVDGQEEDYTYTMYRQPLIKNHDYEIIVPKTGLSPTVDPNNPNNIIYPNERANIEQINVRLFDIQGNLIDSLQYKENTPPMPSIKNLQVFPAGNTIQFQAYNNDVMTNDLYYQLNNGEKSGIISNVPTSDSRLVTITGVSFGIHKLELYANRPFGGAPAYSDRRTVYVQLPDGVYDELTYEPLAPSLPPINLAAFALHRTATTTVNGETKQLADRISVSWEDQNDGSTNYRYRFRQVGFSVNEDRETTETSFNIDFTEQEAIDLEGATFRIEVQAFYENQWSAFAEVDIVLEYFDELPGNVTDLTSSEVIADNNYRLRFSWSDVQYESNYELYYRFKNDNFASFDDYPANQQVVLQQNSTTYFLDANNTFPGLPKIPKNSIIHVVLRPVNQNGAAATDAVREGIVRVHYPFDSTSNPLVITPLNGQSGVRVTIPEALKNTVTAENYVFEDSWYVEYEKGANAVTFPNNITYATNNTKNYFELTGLDPESQYRIRFRGRYTVNGTTVTMSAPPPDKYITVTTGTAAAVPTTAPSISPINLSLGSTSDSARISFSITNNHSPSANVYYLVTANPNTVVSDSVNTGQILNMGQGATEPFASVAVSPGLTYYVRAVAKSGDLPLSTIATQTILVPAFVTGTFTHSGSTWATRSGFAPYTISSVPLPAGTVAWNPSLPRTIPSNTTFFSVAQQLPQFAAPTNLRSLGESTTAITLAWDGPSGATSYNVIGSPGSINLFAPSNSIDVTPLQPGTTYTFQVQARSNSVGTESSFSSPLSVATDAAAPSAPSAPTSVSIASNQVNQVTFSWPAVSGATSYNWQIEYSGTIIDSGTTSNTSVTENGIPAGQVRARVQACNANGCSAFTTSSFVTVSGAGLG